ncbi:MAG TPA: ATP-binding protein [Vicinamibacterales bacterium]|nr:ATP-binding protein [Vicinamibacterales bacterium]
MTKSRLRVPPPGSPDRAGAAPIRLTHPPQAAATSDAFFRHIVSGMRNGVLAIRRDGRLALINDEAYRIFGVAPHSDDVGRPVSAVLRDHPDVLRVLGGVFDLHLLPNRVEMRLKPSNKVIGYTVTLVRDDSNAVIGAAMFFKDLTRVEQLVERERLRDRLAAVGEMAAVIAHEVKNPLAGIEVMAGLLRRKIPEAPDAQGVLTDIITEAKMANAIVQEVLDFVRPIRLQVEHTTIADAVHGAIQLADTKARRGDVQVSLAIPDGLQIQADQHQLTQVFTNLLMNAYEAMAGKGAVAISAELVRLEDGTDPRDAVLVQVVDDGPGMAQDVAERVFNPFFTTKPQGSGLGLAIVRKIVDAHDGRIDLRTSAGKGTTIQVTLPVTGGRED